MWLSHYLYAGAAPRRTTPSVYRIQTYEFTTKVSRRWFSFSLPGSWINRKTVFLRTFFVKGVGKSHNDAASVRTTCHIPASCGLYYFEVKIISKGRDGYMGIGLTASNASNFKMNRLPGKLWANSSLFRLLKYWFLRLGQAIVWVSWRRWKFLLLIWKWTVLWSNLHNKWRHWMRRKLSRQHMFLHQERASSRHRFSWSSTEALPDGGSADTWRDCWRQLWSETFSVWHFWHDTRTSCFHKDGDLFVSTARWSKWLDGDYAKVRRNFDISYQWTLNNLVMFFCIFLGWCHRIWYTMAIVRQPRSSLKLPVRALQKT